MGESESRAFGFPNLARALPPAHTARPTFSLALHAAGVALPALAPAGRLGELGLTPLPDVVAL